MIHCVARARAGTLLFHNWLEARALWERMIRVPKLSYLVLMPDHVHAAVESKTVDEFARAMQAYAQWRNHSRGERGPVWRSSAVSPVRGRQHERRTRRYIHLNPTRKGLVRDPLAWPFSTHRDCVGLALPPIRRCVSDPERFHAQVSADPTVDPQGTELPSPPDPDSLVQVSLDQVQAAVSSLTCTPESGLYRRGPARALVVHAARILTHHSSVEIAEMVGVSRWTVTRAPSQLDRSVRLVRTVLLDSRFALLHETDLRGEPAWAPYRNHG